MHKHLRNILLVATALWQISAQASGVAIDKIYTPYVDMLEHELEYRLIRYEGNDTTLDDTHIHKLGYGHALSEHWFGEVYLLGSNPGNGDFQSEGYEVEARWQVTEQGEYAFDTGFLFEFERETRQDAWELSAALLLTREFGRLVTSTNIYLILEDDKATGRESESAVNFQFLYRLSPHFEPALEIYRAQDTFGIGPMLTGTERLGIGKKLHWEIGVIAGLQDDMPDTILKGLLEFEF